MARISLLITAFLLIMSSTATAQEVVYESGGELPPEKSSYDVFFYDLNLKLNPADSTVDGRVGVHFNVVHPTNVVALDLDPKLEISSVNWTEDEPERAVKIERSDTSKTFYVYFPETLQPGRSTALEIEYSGIPRVGDNPPWDGGLVWKRTPSGEPWVGAALQSLGAWVWWPNKDHPTDKADSVAINFTMPDNLVVASNGRDRGVTDHEDGWKTSHWFVSTPINNYNVTVNAAPYETMSETYTSTAGDEMEIKFWYLPEFREESEWLFPQFAEQIRFLEETAGPYPFRADKYGVAHSPYLGMEHQSIIAYGASFENDNLFGQDAGFDDLHQHELAHEWWGNLVTAWDWRDFWIHEGIGTYMQPLYAEHLNGMESYREMMEFLRTRITSNRATAPRESSMSSLDIREGERGGDVYYKGAWFMHTLRYVVGEDHFFEILRKFAYPTEELENTTTGEQVRYATTDDLLYLSEEISGIDLDWLFEVYLRQAELPALNITRAGLQVVMEWDVPNGIDFPMPVEVRINNEMVTLVPENNRITLEIPESADMEADPNHWILKEL
ncbi:M1 family metallopeptidase [Rhodohalobacter barkolensis]|uniref:Peptidase M1 n=1 Tax=Rhodohalobacter barkolensis TaxID=2053187 RepID=A0A2N0VE00_9BACT|nr:M1 family metallopeptidase [Rhodohalobacter barkolensis]PKD42422.1 peptidase M1 [Rhodohalobacter barkolensis]